MTTQKMQKYLRLLNLRLDIVIKDVVDLLHLTGGKRQADLIDD
jgi:hypothetical protein